MKNLSSKILFALALVWGLNLSVLAQSSKEEVDLFQAAFGMQKKELISGFLKLENDNPFWAIYDEYETKRKDLGKKRIDLLERYVTNYNNMNDDQIESFMLELLILKKNTDRLIDTYYSKVKKACGPKVGAQFFQIENYILSAIRIQIMESIPFIGELDE